jgi:hypothetical protein
VIGRVQKVGPGQAELMQGVTGLVGRP